MLLVLLLLEVCYVNCRICSECGLSMTFLFNTRLAGLPLRKHAELIELCSCERDSLGLHTLY